MVTTSSTSQDSHAADAAIAETNARIIARLITDERAGLRRATVTYRIVGRLLFVAIILVLMGVHPLTAQRWPLAAAMVSLAAIWMVELYLISLHAHMMSRLLAESLYYPDSHLGSLFIQVHHLRYLGSGSAISAECCWESPSFGRCWLYGCCFPSFLRLEWVNEARDRATYVRFRARGWVRPKSLSPDRRTRVERKVR